MADKKEERRMSTVCNTINRLNVVYGWRFAEVYTSEPDDELTFYAIIFRNSVLDEVEVYIFADGNTCVCFGAQNKEGCISLCSDEMWQFTNLSKKVRFYDIDMLQHISANQKYISANQKGEIKNAEKESKTESN